jgi:hypothetical protein
VASGVLFEREKGIRVWYMMCEGRRRRRKRGGKNERGGGSIDANLMRCDAMQI